MACSSSSSSTTFLKCSFQQLDGRNLLLPRRRLRLIPAITRWNSSSSSLLPHYSSEDSNLRIRKYFQLKSSNGCPPLNAVSSNKEPDVAGSEEMDTTISITVVGASGDLAKKKIFPALFALLYEDNLPQHFTVFGYARSKMTDEQLRNMISATLTCRIDQRENCSDKMEQFLQRCFYQSGQSELDNRLREKELTCTSILCQVGKLSNRLFYLSIPPNIFVDVVRCASLRASPFGRDAESSGELTRSLKKYLKEDQIFRIDHYLGKELVENLSVLRFSNLIFEPLWSRNYIRNVQFIFSEDFGTEGRGGINKIFVSIKSSSSNTCIVCNGKTPVSLEAEDTRNEKPVFDHVIRDSGEGFAVNGTLTLVDVTIGQYKGHKKGDRSYPAYTDDPTVPNYRLYFHNCKCLFSQPLKSINSSTIALAMVPLPFPTLLLRVTMFMKIETY
ncbi:hypothetical protein MKX01_028774 [Papaver californicum]|nr:hypothetical protein MKX01_028774 [Papaver californicum]